MEQTCTNVSVDTRIPFVSSGFPFPYNFRESPSFLPLPLLSLVAWPIDSYLQVVSSCDARRNYLASLGGCSEEEEGIWRSTTTVASDRLIREKRTRER